MTNFQIETFWFEIDQIQLRHHVFFPSEQKLFIQLSKVDGQFVLTFLEGYDLPSCITLEINFCFKIVFF